MAAHHYLGALPKIGHTLWYVATWNGEWLALMSFSAAAWKCAARDAWIEPFLAELCLFPAGAHDDQVDAFADALNDLALAPAPFVWSVGGVEIAAA